MPNPDLRRGSEWHRWDLHVHSPLSILANEFPHHHDGSPDWEQYLSTLEALRDFSVLGITDYFSVDGCREVSRFKKSGRLKNIDLRKYMIPRLLCWMRVYLNLVVFVGAL